MRREYDIEVTINGIKIKKAIIDPHYEEKHAESINDEIILSLIRTLHGSFYEPEDIKGNYSYFVLEKQLNNKNYKIVWLLEDEEIYIGIINTYRI